MNNFLKLVIVTIGALAIIGVAFIILKPKDIQQPNIVPSNTLPSVGVETIEHSPIFSTERTRSPKELYVTAVGKGKLPANMPAGQAKAMAKRAAITDAQRNLLKSVSVTLEKFRANISIEKVNGFIKNADILSERKLADGSIEVEMAVTIYF